ncbi:CynX/NimT family MFS transporter [Streptomyces turgidiscabies]|uniref:Transporter, major facilitator family protein n=1 Tax=Streptomyces turgidiscabies (strain Car8) TaxID=698760 RepID=L7FEE7_STRT8|nr:MULTISPECIES: MFS transporter [Streptomyces]ELP69667.1 transporter, major facilitator family protein [Streptomyces turgidiscabies Car8]MDX3493031.1 MFS transporter [Streptomyces turgidiscabies]GAQ74404.1 putative transporter YycB [Streptomyces turgidiscabies]
MPKSESNRPASHPDRNTSPRTTSSPTASTSPSTTSRNTRRLALAALVLAALNLRPGVTSLGPVLEEVRDSLSMSGTTSGVLTSIPAACFALIGSTAPALARRYGAAGAIAAAAVVLTAGLALRPFATDPALFVVLTALSLAGIAIANVLLPAVVKERFPDRVGAMTGLYSMALNAGASSAAAVTVPLTEAFGGDWRYGLGAWSVLAAMAVPPWLALARRRPPPGPDPVAADAPQQPPPRVPLSRDPTAWALTAYFGLQASSAYIIIGWLPQIFRDSGLSAQTAGLLFSGTSLLGVPLSFALSALAGKLRHQSGIAAAIGVCGLAGFTGLWADPASTPWLWAFLLGVANCSFPLALTMIGMRGRDGASVVRLSGFVQGFGYLLSIPGPVVVGVLYDRSDGWRLPLGFVLLLTLVQIAAGLLAGRNRQIG